MTEIPQTRELAMDDLRLLAYLKYMAQTAQSDAGKRLFELFAEQEFRRLEADGCFRFPTSGHGSGRAQASLASVGREGPNGPHAQDQGSIRRKQCDRMRTQQADLNRPLKSMETTTKEKTIMKTQIVRYMGVAAIVSVVAATGCGRQSGSESSETPGVAERTGAALDRAADRTGEAVRSAGEATKDATGRAIERTGETMENVGESMERTGSKMQSEEPEVMIEE